MDYIIQHNGLNHTLIPVSYTELTLPTILRLEIHVVLASLQDMEPRRMLSSIKVIFVEGSLNDTVATKMNMNSTVIVLDFYHLLNCIWTDSLGESAQKITKKNKKKIFFKKKKKK